MTSSSPRPKIAYHRPSIDTREAALATSALPTAGGFGPYLLQVEAELRRRTGAAGVLGMSSATHGLESILWALGIGPGDEVIVPAYGFPSTAACVLRQRGRIIFADCLPDDPQIDPASVAARMTARTKAVIVIHYGGLPADLDRLLAATTSRGIALVEDAAHSIDASFRGLALGTFGRAGVLSFHASKNLSCGEGGALLSNDLDLLRRVDQFRHMGTDRGAMLRGEASSYTWRSEGTSFLPSELAMAVLVAQLEKGERVRARRVQVFARYSEALRGLPGLVLPTVPPGASHNGHIFHVVLPSGAMREKLQGHLANLGIEATRHYQSLDRTPMGSTLDAGGKGENPHAEALAERLLRLPIHAELSDSEVDFVCDSVRRFFR